MVLEVVLKTRLESSLMTVETVHACSMPQFTPALAVKTPDWKVPHAATLYTQPRRHVKRLVIIGGCIAVDVAKILRGGKNVKGVTVTVVSSVQVVQEQLLTILATKK